MTVYCKGFTLLTGGGAGSLDSELTANIGDGDPAVVIVEGGNTYFYIADINSGAAEDIPNVIAPNDVGAGDLRWVLVTIYSVHNSLGGLNDGDFQHLLASEYTELSDWLDDVVLGSNGLTTIPELVLDPRAAALVDSQGGMYYSNVDDSIYVCTSDT